MKLATTHKPLITVVGAASKQGRSVAHGLLDSGRYRVRALTRRRDSEPAQVLAQRGAEVVVVPLQTGMQAELTAAMRGLGRSVSNDSARRQGATGGS